MVMMGFDHPRCDQPIASSSERVAGNSNAPATNTPELAALFGAAGNVCQMVEFGGNELTIGELRESKNFRLLLGVVMQLQKGR